MESAVFKIDVRAGTVRVKNALFLGSTYAVTIEGYTYTGTPPTITLSDHKGNPLAVSEVDEQDGHIISLDTQELLDYFEKCHWKGCIKAANVHCTVNTTDATLASSTMPVFWSQYYTAPSGTLTKIDAKGPKGDPGEPGPKGDKGDDGTVITARGFFHFTVDEDSHLWVHASREQDLYEMGPDGQPDTTKPLFVLGDGTGGTEAFHLYYVVYDPGDGQTSRKLDLGYVKGQDGEAFVPDIDSVPTANSSNLVESGGVAQAIADAGTAQTAALNGAVATINTALNGKANASAVYTKAEVDAIVAAVKTGSRQVVESLDSVIDPQPLVIYMVAKSSAQTSNIYDEYIWLVSEGVGSWEKIGDTEIDLSGYQPIIADLATIRSGAAAGATAYQKPATGIPATDLAASVQTSLGKADTALQTAPVQSVNNRTGAVVLDAPDVNAFYDSSVAYNYAPGLDYAKDDYCTYQGVIYKAVGVIIDAPDPFDDSQWESVEVMGEVAAKQDALTSQQLANIAAVPDKANAADLRYALPSDPLEPDSETGKYTLNDRTANWINLDVASVTVVFPPPISGRLRDFELRINSVSSGTGNVSLTCEAYDASEIISIGNGDGAVPDIPLGGDTVLYFSEVKEGGFILKGEEFKAIAQGGN